MSSPAATALEQARALFFEGVTQLEQQHHVEAERLLRQALALLPQRVSIILNLAAALIAQNKLSEARALSERALRLEPDNTAAWLNLGICQSRDGALHDALASLDQVLIRQADNGEALFCRSEILYKLGDYSSAREAIERVLSTSSPRPEHWLVRGNVLHELRELADALKSYDKAIAMRDDFADAWLNRSVVLRDLDRHDEALASCRTTVGHAPDIPLAWQNLAMLLQEMRQHEEAIDAIDRAYALAPHLDGVISKRLHYRMHACLWDDFAAISAELIDSLSQPEARPDPASLLPIASTPWQQHECAARYVRKLAPAASQALSDGKPYAHERLRIGYFSSDYYEHATAYLMIGLFEQHDRTRFETFAFSFGRNTGDVMRQRLEKSFDHFIDVRDKNDAEVAALVRSLEIDIAVDLKGLTSNGRPRIFAFRPAPLQVSYLGYPGTLGVDYFDYLIADETLIPPEHRDAYSEKIVYMPDSYQINDAGRRISESPSDRAQCGLPPEGFVFCCFNNNYKITPDVFAIWMRLLAATPGSVLWLMESNEAARRNLRRSAQASGVESSRLVFARHAPLADHLARHVHADLFLDTFHYNAHTTCSDALWAGLPVVACLGQAFPGRVAASLLRAADLPELVTQSPADYEALALSLAQQPQRLAALRHHLLGKRQQLRLFDTTRFARHIESAYLVMQARLVSGATRDHIFVADPA